MQVGPTFDLVPRFQSLEIARKLMPTQEICSQHAGSYRIWVFPGKLTFQIIHAICVGVLLSLCTTPIAADEAEEADTVEFTEYERTYWAYQPLTKPAVPEVSEDADVKTPIDAFLLKRLSDKGLGFSPVAERREFIRRATYDLWGLPPAPEDVEAFVNDQSPNAYETLIDRLLASPRYGERWGRYWLDVVRFAESAGFNADPLRPLAYKYRDYVIRAFNDDTPYNRFVEEQLAGDELFPDDKNAQIATGFNRLWPDESNASNVELARQSMLNDMTGTVGAVFMGMSFGCAECHDHKFDPIPQKDFYRLQAFFAPMIPVENVPFGADDAMGLFHQELEAWNEESAALRKELWELELTARVKVTHVKRLKFPDVVLEAIDTPPWERTAYQKQLAFWSERQIEFKEEQIVKKLDDAQKARREELKQELKELEERKPAPPEEMKIMATVDGMSIPSTSLLAGGSYNKPLEKVEPGFPTILNVSHRFQPAKIEPPRDGTTGRRATLARWLTDPANPLTARVMVNRIWQGHFGQGIVSNANDFGTQTPLPTHPELIDWLALEFMNQGWSIKAMHRLIMNSAAYRQSSRIASAEVVENDPGNQLYSRFPRRRLDAESIRDGMLAVSGQLNLKMYGPGVKPDLPPNLNAVGMWKPSKEKAERNRRSIYILSKRNFPYPLLQVFDFPDTHESCARRQETTIAPQALALLNSGLILRFSETFTAKLAEENVALDLNRFVEAAYKEALGRPPMEEEATTAVEFINTQRELIAQRRDDDKPSQYPESLPPVYDPALAGALVDFCHALLNCNEFVYLD